MLCIGNAILTDSDHGSVDNEDNLPLSGPAAKTMKVCCHTITLWVALHYLNAVVSAV